jgi:hypothetical protein
VDPYRGELVRLEPRSLVAEAERPPRAIRVRAWSDGTARIRLRPRAKMALPWIVTVLFAAAAAAVSHLECSGFAVACGLFGAILAGRVAVRGSLGETIVITPAALMSRKWPWRRRVFAIADVSTVVVTGVGDETRLDLQCGRERMQLADGLGYDEARLRWIAQRLRRALEAAR